MLFPLFEMKSFDNEQQIVWSIDVYCPQWRQTSEFWLYIQLEIGWKILFSMRISGSQFTGDTFRFVSTYFSFGSNVILQWVLKQFIWDSETVHRFRFYKTKHVFLWYFERWETAFALTHAMANCRWWVILPCRKA